MATNSLGLARTIPESIKREVRQRSKFGCVRCRCGIYQYHHLDEGYVNTDTHSADDICLLCGSCHQAVHGGSLSNETVRQLYKRVENDPAAKRPFEQFDLSTRPIAVCLGSSRFESPQTLIRVGGRDVLTINTDDEDYGGISLSGVFCDNTGKELLRVSHNEWEASTHSWDVETKGRLITVRRGPKQVALRIRAVPPSEIAIEYLDMFFMGAHIMCDPENLLIGRNSYSTDAYLGIGKIDCSGASIAVDIADLHGVRPRFFALNVIGGQGIELVGAGLRIAVGASAMTSRDLRVVMPPEPTYRLSANLMKVLPRSA